MEELTDEQICKNLKKLYDETEERVKVDAMVRRAYTDRISSETINEKVTAQMNAIKVGIYDINPKFKEGSKNYDSTKKLVSETLANYESALVELSEFYDGKIEQLILRKVELEANLLGSILNQEYLAQKLNRKNEQKEKDKVKNSVKDNIKLTIERLKNFKKDKTEIDAREIASLMDKQDIASEIDQKLDKRIEKSVGDKKENKESMMKFEKEIALIDDEIDRINQRKQKSIFDAMEVGDKSIAINIRKPRMFKKITRFFVARFNTAKIVEANIIAPLNLRIESFKNNELLDMKG